jgi:hypothetical protein
MPDKVSLYPLVVNGGQLQLPGTAILAGVSKLGSFGLLLGKGLLVANSSAFFGVLGKTPYAADPRLQFSRPDFPPEFSAAVVEVPNRLPSARSERRVQCPRP